MGVDRNPWAGDRSSALGIPDAAVGVHRDGGRHARPIGHRDAGEAETSLHAQLPAVDLADGGSGTGSDAAALDLARGRAVERRLDQRARGGGTTIAESEVEQDRGGHDRHQPVAGLKAVALGSQSLQNRIGAGETVRAAAGEHHRVRLGVQAVPDPERVELTRTGSGAAHISGRGRPLWTEDDGHPGHRFPVRAVTEFEPFERQSAADRHVGRQLIHGARDSTPPT